MARRRWKKTSSLSENMTNRHRSFGDIRAIPVNAEKPTDNRVLTGL